MQKIIHCIISLEIGGAEMMLAKVAHHTDYGRFQPMVVSLGSPGPIGNSMVKNGIPVLALGKKPGHLDLRTVWQLYRILRREKPALIQTHLYEANIYGLLAASLAGIPIIWGIRNADLDYSYYRLRSRLSFLANRFFSSRPEAILVNSHAGRTYHIAKGFDGRKMVVIPNGFELDRFHPNIESRHSVRKELGLDPDALLIGRVARFDPMKDYPSLIQACKQVTEKVPSAFFLFIGREVTGENEDLRQQIRSHGLEKQILLLGQREDIPRLMAGMDIAVSSSRTEGFPNVIGEAMACGTPCVATDVGDCRFLLGTTGRIVPPKRPELLAEALISIAQLPGEDRRQLGMQARHRILDHFEIGKVTRQVEALYNHILADQSM